MAATLSTGEIVIAAFRAGDRHAIIVQDPTMAVGAVKILDELPWTPHPRRAIQSPADRGPVGRGLDDHQRRHNRDAEGDGRVSGGTWVRHEPDDERTGR